jgi:hypothetical protein
LTGKHERSLESFQTGLNYYLDYLSEEEPLVSKLRQTISDVEDTIFSKKMRQKMKQKKRDQLFKD